MRQRPDLIVPVKDRRQHKRYLTLKNVAIAGAVSFVLFLVISVLSETRRPAPNEYGRLAKQEIPVKVEQKPMDVVSEDVPAIDDQSSADPTLVEPMARQQWLGGSDNTSSASVMPPVPPPPPPATVRGEGVAIVGGPEGVTLVQQKKRHPVLAGGFGRTDTQ